MSVSTSLLSQFSMICRGGYHATGAMPDNTHPLECSARALHLICEISLHESNPSTTVHQDERTLFITRSSLSIGSIARVNNRISLASAPNDVKTFSLPDISFPTTFLLILVRKSARALEGATTQHSAFLRAFICAGMWKMCGKKE